MAQKEITIDRFDGGIAEDKRTKSSNKYSITKHFDAFTYPHKLVPYPKTQALANEDKTMDIVKFLYAPYSSGALRAYRLYGFGQKATGESKIYHNDIDGGDYLNESWTSEAAGYSESEIQTRDENVFFYYKEYIYVFDGARYIERYGVDNATGWGDNWKDLTSYSTACQPIHHPNDIAYFFYDNYVSELNDATWSAKKLTLPDNIRIVTACVYGNYLAIGCVTKGISDVKSIVYLWDTDAVSWNEAIEFGSGKIEHLASLDNRLIAVIDHFASTDSAGGLGISAGKVYIKTYSYGQVAQTINELVTDAETSLFPDTRVVKDNKLYFPMRLDLNGDQRHGIWAVNSRGNATLEIIDDDQPASYEGIFATGNVWWIAHSNDGSTNVTSPTGAYSSNNISVYESLIFNGGDTNVFKKLIGASVSFEPLGGNVRLYYRKDEDINGGSWAGIIVEATADKINMEAVLADTNHNDTHDTPLPEYKEIQFRLESKAGAVITGFKFKYEEVDKKLY